MGLKYCGHGTVRKETSVEESGSAVTIRSIWNADVYFNSNGDETSEDILIHADSPEYRAAMRAVLYGNPIAAALGEISPEREQLSRQRAEGFSEGIGKFELYQTPFWPTREVNAGYADKATHQRWEIRLTMPRPDKASAEYRRLMEAVREIGK